MAEFDLFADQLLEESKRFLEKASEASDDVTEAANLHAALLLSMCALEAHVNAIGEEFSEEKTFSAHEKGFLLERTVKLEHGEFRVQPGLKMSNLEDRIEFLHAKFSGKPIPAVCTWWAELASAIQLRNKLVHAKSVAPISYATVRSAVMAVVETLDALYQAVYKRPFPPLTQGVHSRLNF